MLLIGFILLVPMSVRVALWGRRRALPRAWMAWLPLLAPVLWLAGTIATSVSARSRYDALGALPASERAVALSNGLADALELSLAGAIAAVAVLAGCFAFFALRPRTPEPVDEEY